MAVIFLSYRRDDTAGYAGRLADDLRERFGSDSVFQDVDAIPAGSEFPRVIEEAVGRCRVMIALIGDTWITEAAADGSRRLDRSDDFVRVEVASALRRGAPVIPVLVEGARMPRPNELPPDLERLARIQSLDLSDTRWESDLDRLTRAIERLGGPKAHRGEERAGPPPTRRLLVMGIGGFALAALVGAGLYMLTTRERGLTGRWNLPDGSYWIIVEEADGLRIEEVHYASREVWKRGRGRVEGGVMTFTLDLVYGGIYRYRGEVKLTADGRTLSGTITEVTSGAAYPMSASRAPKSSVP